jgi:hypothetical protein
MIICVRLFYDALSATDILCIIRLVRPGFINFLEQTLYTHSQLYSTIPNLTTKENITVVVMIMIMIIIIVIITDRLTINIYKSTYMQLLCIRYSGDSM